MPADGCCAKPTSGKAAEPRETEDVGHPVSREVAAATMALQRWNAPGEEGVEDVAVMGPGQEAVALAKPLFVKRPLGRRRPVAVTLVRSGVRRTPRISCETRLNDAGARRRAH